MTLIQVILTIWVLSFGNISAKAGNITPSLRREIESFQVRDAIIELPQVISSVAAEIQGLHAEEKSHTLVSMLQNRCSHLQAPFVAKIEQLGLQYQTFWASNIILVKALNLETLNELLLIQKEFTIREEKRVSIPPLRKGRSYPSLKDLPIEQPTWGLKMIGANRAWLHSTGNGSIIGVIDTGVYLNHQSLRDNFGGAWADPVYNRPTPEDGHGHGTHVTGTACGRKGSIGVAPRAKWVACRGLDNQGSGTEGDLTTCAQFMVTADPKPHVVSCSWGGGQGDIWYNSQIQTWRAAGIIPVFAIGNEGSFCRTASSPGDQPNLISVGASTDFDTLASFSSRGPSTVGMRLKPEMAAPGENVLSADALQGGFVEMSGTSMAAPHVSGAVALLLAKNPSWGFDEVFAALTSYAARPRVTIGDRNCGLPTEDEFPNNAWGWGRIDVYAAILNSTKSHV